MPLVGLSEAARLARKDKSTIHRALQTGRLSYTTTETGEGRIDTAELDRVFPLGRINGGDEVAQPVAQRRREDEHMQRLLDDRDATIRDLRQRLDDSETERRGVQAKLTALLAAPTKPAEPDTPRPLGRRPLAWLARQHGW